VAGDAGFVAGDVGRVVFDKFREVVEAFGMFIQEILIYAAIADDAVGEGIEKWEVAL
jgi:hypothetical protein